MYSLIALYIYLYFKLTYFLLLHLPLVRIACMYMQRSMQCTLAHKANTMARNGTLHGYLALALLAALAVIGNAMALLALCL